MIYLDYAATTPVERSVAEQMQQYLTLDGHFGNPASATHPLGWTAAKAIERARQHVAELINAEPTEIIFTSGATEANNLAIKGLAQAHPERRHIITCATEHKAVLDCCAALAEHGYKITRLPVDRNGLVTIEQIAQAIQPDTLLISIMTVNNETGVIQDIPAIAALAKMHGIFMHSDASQSVGKLPIDIQTTPVDLLSISSHKMYGPKGIGALYVRSGIQLTAQITGGGQERGLRAGTLPTHQIVGLGAALALAQTYMSADYLHVQNLATQLKAGLSSLDGIQFMTSEVLHSPYIHSITITGVNNQRLMSACPELAFSAGSACTSSSPEFSHVLKAMGFSRKQADHTIRLSLGRFLTEDDIIKATTLLTTQIQRLRN